VDRRAVKRWLWIVLGVVTGLYFFCALVLWLRQAKYVYHPTWRIEATPADVGLTYEDVYLTTADHVRLNGWFIPAEAPRGVILLFHGNGGNIGHRVETLAVLSRLGFSTFIIDYRGYGASGGSLSEQGTYLDAEAAWRYLVEQRGAAPEEIVLFGRSLGGVFAAYLAQTHRAAAVIVDSALTSAPDLAAELFPAFPVRRLLRFNYPTIDYLAKAQCPVLVLHSPDDEMVPFHHGRRLFAAAPEPKEFHQLVGSHDSGYEVRGDAYVADMDAFLKRHAGR